MQDPGVEVFEDAVVLSGVPSSDAEVRATTSKGSDRVQSILEEAKNILVRDGFPALSYRAIAKAAGIAVGNVNYYYPNKDDLLIDVAQYIFNRWDDKFRRKMPVSISTPKEIFGYSIRFMIEENKREKTVLLLMEMWAIANHTAAVAKMLDAFYGKMRAWIDAMIDQANPGLDPTVRAHRAALITAQIEGLMILIGPRRLPHKELVGLEAAAVKHIEALAFAP
ncbi:TetR/AcrR family transcriptional regulator [Methylorubrum rhodesianum]|uniref:TetR/AcrR family transcriptional regulator n=1 Tax=Methylorubrum rhodesianum TaxID=29427 RepID=UPI003D02EA53